MTVGEQLLMIFLVVVVIAVLIGVPYFFLLGGAKTFLLKNLHHRYDGVDVRAIPTEGDVGFVYHTYRGFLFWFIQDEHRVFAKPEQAEILLARLMRFNLTWGLMNFAVLFIPFFTIGNYLAQKRSIEIQSVRQKPGD